MNSALEIKITDPALPEPRRLIGELDAYLQERYPAESNYLLSVEELRRPEVTFYTAFDDVRAVGCGAVVRHAGYAEIKRMYIMPEYRGRRIGQLILEKMEAEARASGLSLARLETGVYQPEALKLYERCGYARCLPYGSYNPDDPLSVFMEKQL